MRRADIEALGELAGEALAGGGTLIREMHEGIAGRPLAVLGPAAAPVRVIHNGISRAVYSGVSQGLRTAARGGARVAARRASEHGTPIGSRPRGSAALGALNGVYGSRLQGPVRLEMQFRRRGAHVPATAGGLAAAFPDATSRIAVFVHGLCETDEAWWAMSRRPDGTRRRNYGERLQDELSFTPVYLRYNTGLHVSENGRGLARQLEALVAGWPMGVEELVLVGHSMGGLVARSACHYAEETGLTFTDAVRHVFCLGRPHLGSGVEKGASMLGGALARFPETHALAKLLDARSDGIKDLRPAPRIEADWCGCDPDEFLRDRAQELTGVNHFELLNHPAVYRQLRMWITRRTPAAAKARPASVR